MLVHCSDASGEKNEDCQFYLQNNIMVVKDGVLIKTQDDRYVSLSLYPHFDSVTGFRFNINFLETLKTLEKPKEVTQEM